MSEQPPKKKLCQLSILSMLSKNGPSSNPKKGPIDTLSSENEVLSHKEQNSEVKRSSSPVLPTTQENLQSSAAESKETMNLLRAERCSLLAQAAEKRMLASTSVSNGGSTSPDMFDSSQESCTMSWRGAPLDALSSLSMSNANVPPVIPAPDHKILIELPLSLQGDPKPFPSKYRDIWDDRHVRMPNSPCSLYPQSKSGDEPRLIPRWALICNAYKNPIKNVDELLQAILSYNHRYKNKWKFFGLKTLLQEEMSEEEQDYFFDVILPGIIDLALSIPNVVTTPPPLLQKNTNASITMSQKQVACLLANAFLCTFPRRNAKGGDSEYSSYPDINFNRLFYHKNHWALEKMKCIIHYFKEMNSKGRIGLITFSRQFVAFKDSPRFEESNKPLPKLHIDSKGLIEEATGLLQVDFANKYLGGGVLGLGCVQEEIRFVLCPELLVTRLFTERLDKRDSFIITGPEQFSRGSGYSSKFKWEGSYNDLTPVDDSLRKLCQVVALDALHFVNKSSVQYEPELIMRELLKAYAGFHVLEGSEGNPVAVATGNWGCGAFNGDPRLKGLIQLAAAAEAGRDVAYFTFEDSKLRDQLADIHQYLTDKGITVGELVMVLCQYGTKSGADGRDLYHYIRYNISVDHSDTDSGNNADVILASEGKEEEKPLDKISKKISQYFQPSPKSWDGSTHKKCTLGGTGRKSVVSSNQNCTASNTLLREDEIQDFLDQCEKGLSSKNILDTDHSPKDSSDDKKDPTKTSLGAQELKSDDDASSGRRLFDYLDEIDRSMK